MTSATKSAITRLMHCNIIGKTLIGGGHVVLLSFPMT
jgi:hypothetical protein